MCVFYSLYILIRYIFLAPRVSQEMPKRGRIWIGTEFCAGLHWPLALVRFSWWLLRLACVQVSSCEFPSYDRATVVSAPRETRGNNNRKDAFPCFKGVSLPPRAGLDPICANKLPVSARSINTPGIFQCCTLATGARLQSLSSFLATDRYLVGGRALGSVP